MAGLRDDSILFSLNSLLERERQRISEEAEREAKRLEAELQARIERERLAREAEKARLLEEAQRELRDEQRRREEAARVEGLRQAEIERARTEAEARARLELVARQHEHEKNLTVIRERGRRAFAERLAIVLGIALFFSLAGAFGFYFGKIRPEAARLEVASQTLLDTERSRANVAQRLFERSERQRSKLGEELERLKRELDALRTQPKPAPAPRAGRGRPSPAPVKKRPDCKDDDDPLNPCLKGAAG